jgi:hypothetical protein
MIPYLLTVRISYKSKIVNPGKSRGKAGTGYSPGILPSGEEA